MPNRRKVVIDTNFFEWLKRIDSDCGLVDLICDSYSGNGVADHDQLALMDYCQDLSALLAHHGITDEQVAEFTLGYQGKLNLLRINDDPTDLKFIVFARNNYQAAFLTCETKLLELSEEQGIDHACFKAAVHRLHDHVGGVLDDGSYSTSSMFESDGVHPYFHYANKRRCRQCDPRGRCKTQSSPPTA